MRGDIDSDATDGATPMATCDACGQSILFGGAREGEFRFCNKACLQNGRWMLAAELIPEEVVAGEVGKIRAADCPQCGGPGPVDIHKTHHVWSAIAMTRWRTKAQFSCASCGAKAKYKALASSMLLGWWGFPWGLIWTPIQVGRNLKEILGKDTSLEASPDLVKTVKMRIASSARQTA